MLHRLPLAALFLLAVPAAPAAEPTYWQDVRPALRKHCTVCHSVKNLSEVDLSGGLALLRLGAGPYTSVPLSK